jgi:hypothetical protein
MTQTRALTVLPLSRHCPSERPTTEQATVELPVQDARHPSTLLASRVFLSRSNGAMIGPSIRAARSNHSTRECSFKPPPPLRGSPNFLRCLSESQDSTQAAFQRLLTRALPSAIEPRLELADAHGVLGLGLLYADGEAGGRAEHDLREPAPAELGERQHGRFEHRRGGDFDRVFETLRIDE